MNKSRISGFLIKKDKGYELLLDDNRGIIDVVFRTKNLIYNSEVVDNPNKFLDKNSIFSGSLRSNFRSGRLNVYLLIDSVEDNNDKCVINQINLKGSINKDVLTKVIKNKTYYISLLKLDINKKGVYNYIPLITTDELSDDNLEIFKNLKVGEEISIFNSKIRNSLTSKNSKEYRVTNIEVSDFRV